MYDNEECMMLVHQGKNLMFIFKTDSEKFAFQNKLKIEYNDGEFIDFEHYEVKGYNSKLYWFAP